MGLLGQRFSEKIQNGGRRSVTFDWLDCLGWRRSFNNFIGWLHFVVLQLRTKLFSNAGYAAKLPQNAYFSIRPKNVLFFRATFEQVSLQKATFVVSWAIFEQLFGKSRATCVKPYQFHMLMQKIIKILYHRHRSRFRYQAHC